MAESRRAGMGFLDSHPDERALAERLVTQGRSVTSTTVADALSYACDARTLPGRRTVQRYMTRRRRPLEAPLGA